MVDAWRIRPERVSQELWARIKQIAENPEMGERDTEEIFGGAYIYEFWIDCPPIDLPATVAYDVLPDTDEVWVLDVVPRRVR